MAIRFLASALIFVGYVMSAGGVIAQEIGEHLIEMYCYDDPATGEVKCDIYSESEIVATCVDQLGEMRIEPGQYNEMFRHCVSNIVNNSPLEDVAFADEVAPEFGENNQNQNDILDNPLENTEDTTVGRQSPNN